MQHFPGGAGVLGNIARVGSGGFRLQAGNPVEDDYIPAAGCGAFKVKGDPRITGEVFQFDRTRPGVDQDALAVKVEPDGIGLRGAVGEDCSDLDHLLRFQALFHPLTKFRGEVKHRILHYR